MSDLLFRPIHELAALVRSGELSARELVGASLERIDALDGEINAFTPVEHEGALAAAEQIGRDDPRPFAGVPIAIKDNRPVARMPLTLGSKLMNLDAAVRRRLRAAAAGGRLRDRRQDGPAGVRILPSTESVRNGPTRNLWDLTRTPGGSSGGAGGGGRGRAGADRARQRRRRLAAHPRRLLRPRRAEAERAAASRSAPVDGRVVPGHQRRAHPHGRRDRGRARPARRPGARRRLVGAGAVGAVRADGRAARPAGCGSA